MRVAFLTSYVSRRAGGLFNSVRRLSQTLAAREHVDVSVLALQDEFVEHDLAAWEPLRPATFPLIGPQAIGYAPALRRALFDLRPDLVHTQGLWMYPSVASHRWARQSGRPYVVTPRGMLDPWALRNSGWKKRLAGTVFENSHLRSAACLHALCESELRSMRAYGLRNPVCVIPNGVDPPGDDDGTPAPWNGAVPEGRRVLLYLGRLHPKKGLPQLLRAWKLAQKDSPEALSWDLAFVGWDQNRHLHALQQLAQEMEIRVHFLGPQFGKAREAACRQANAFILPSLSEGLPMVVLEAWAHGKPVLMTPQCNLPEGFAAKAAIEISADTHGIARGLQTLFSMNQRDLGSMGAKGRTLAAERFAWPKIAADTRAVYAWLLGDAGKPACVIDA